MLLFLMVIRTVYSLYIWIKCLCSSLDPFAWWDLCQPKWFRLRYPFGRSHKYANYLCDWPGWGWRRRLLGRVALQTLQILQKKGNLDNFLIYLKFFMKMIFFGLSLMRSIELLYSKIVLLQKGQNFLKWWLPW